MPFRSIFNKKKKKLEKNLDYVNLQYSRSLAFCVFFVVIEYSRERVTIRNNVANDWASVEGSF